LGQVTTVLDQNYAYFCSGTNRVTWDMATAGVPAGSPYGFSIEQNAVPADIAGNKFHSVHSVNCSRTI